MKTEEKERNDRDEMTFETALARLEQIVKELEGGSVPLDDLMKLYDEGTELVKLCTEKISAAEQKVRLVQMKNGSPAEEDFEAK